MEVLSNSDVTKSLQPTNNCGADSPTDFAQGALLRRSLDRAFDPSIEMSSVVCQAWDCLINGNLASTNVETSVSDLYVFIKHKKFQSEL